MSKVRVLHIANNLEYKENPITRAFQSFGFIVHEIDFVDMFQNRKMNQISFGDSVVRAMQSFKPNFVFMQVQHEGIVNISTAKRMTEICPVISWTGDVREDISWHFQMAQAGVLTMFSNEDDVDTLRKNGHYSEFLQVGFDRTIHKPEIEQPAQLGKIVFIGNKYNDNLFPLSKERGEMVLRLKKEFGDDFHVYGNGWDTLGVKAYPIKESNCSLIYNSYKIAINQNHFSRARYSSNRLLYAMAAKTFVLAQGYPLIGYDFAEKKELDVFSDIDDLVNKCHYYLDENNENEREQIASKGYNYVVHNFTWESIMISLIPKLLKYYPNAMNENDNWIASLKNFKAPKVFSQSGEEYYIGHIFNCIGAKDKFFVDLGAGDGFTLSNTALLKRDYEWKGVMIDADNKGNDEVMKEFINATNIISLLEKYQVPKAFDLLSIDLDGNDYWILDKLLEEYRPRLIVAEFNGTIPLGVDKVMAYNENHTWGNDDYYGASLDAFKRLGKIHDYTAVFCHDSLNVYLVADEELANPQADFGVTYLPQQYHKHNPDGKWEMFN